MDEHFWRQFFTGVPQFRSDMTYLAVAIAGFCINWENETKNEQTGIQQVWIEAVNVIPSWRSQGIVSALLVHTMLRFLAAGMERAALAVDTQNPTGALSLNENLGFMAVKRTINFTKVVNSED
ncbi:MAG TPA: GNAT family N-acetyltransferase [Anaerolineales bacterium]|nr:GNAT family N-acetyltransferase [Anaerolineales bacterium]